MSNTAPKLSIVFSRNPRAFSFAGGFHFISVEFIDAFCEAVKQKQLSQKSLRILFAKLEIEALKKVTKDSEKLIQDRANAMTIFDACNPKKQQDGYQVKQLRKSAIGLVESQDVITKLVQVSQLNKGTKAIPRKFIRWVAVGNSNLSQVALMLEYCNRRQLAQSERALSASNELIINQPYARVRLDQIASKIGVSKNAISKALKELVASEFISKLWVHSRSISKQGLALEDGKRVFYNWEKFWSKKRQSKIEERQKLKNFIQMLKDSGTTDDRIQEAVANYKENRNKKFDESRKLSLVTKS